MSENNYILEPFQIRDVHTKHEKGVFSDFHHMIDLRISALQHTENREKLLFVSFLKNLKENFDNEQYASIQREFLPEAKAQMYGNMMKYLDSIRWFESKMDLISKLNLHDSDQMNILDIGTGTGHFLALANFFGHTVKGANLSRDKLRPIDKERHLYAALCDFFNIETYELMVRPNTSIDTIPEKFDLVTALMTEFNHIDGKPWGNDLWDFFLEDLKKSCLKPNGSIFLGLTNGKLSEESWGHLKSKATWFDEDKKYIFIQE